jgi:hypothetical protein
MHSRSDRHVANIPPSHLFPILLSLCSHSITCSMLCVLSDGSMLLDEVERPAVQQVMGIDTYLTHVKLQIISHVGDSVM